MLSRCRTIESPAALLANVFKLQMVARSLMLLLLCSLMCRWASYDVPLNEDESLRVSIMGTGERNCCRARDCHVEYHGTRSVKLYTNWLGVPCWLRCRMLTEKVSGPSMQSRTGSFFVLWQSIDRLLKRRRYIWNLFVFLWKHRGSKNIWNNFIQTEN